MDGSYDEPVRPASGPPKYLPRIKYEEPELDPDAENAEKDGGEIPLGDAPVSQKPKSKPVSQSLASPIAPKPKKPDTPPKKSSSEARPSIRETLPSKPEPKPKKNPTRFESSTDSKAHGVEQTPEGETFEGRRRIRLMITGAASCVILLSLFVVWRSLRSNDVEVDSGATAGQSADFVEAGPQPKRSPAELESAARTLLADARSLEKSNKAKQALAKVEKVLSEYSETPSAKIALAAKERNRQGLPLFVNGAAVVAIKAEMPVAVEPAVEPDAPAAEPADLVVVAPVKATLVPNSVPVMPTTPGSLAPEPRRPIEVGLPRAKVAARPLPAGFRARTEAGVHASGWPLEILCERDGGTLMLVPGDRFIQGRDDGKLEERPAHRVQLSTYYIDQHETTGRQFAAFRPGGSPVDDRAAVNVTLNEARSYAQWAGKSLPTEAQWEMAARTTDARLHPWGNAAASWERARQAKQIDPVMSFPSDMSPYGVFDLAGNAWEWTNDWFDTKSYALMKGQTTINPTGPTRGAGRIPEVVIKGGSKDWDAAWRTGMRTDAKLPYLGFRCVLNLDGGGALQPAGAAPVPVNTPPSGGAVPF